MFLFSMENGSYVYDFNTMYVSVGKTCVTKRNILIQQNAVCIQAWTVLEERCNHTTNDSFTTGLMTVDASGLQTVLAQYYYSLPIPFKAIRTVCFDCSYDLNNTVNSRSC